MNPYSLKQFILSGIKNKVKESKNISINSSGSGSLEAGAMREFIVRRLKEVTVRNLNYLIKWASGYHKQMDPGERELIKIKSIIKMKNVGHLDKKFPSDEADPSFSSLRRRGGERWFQVGSGDLLSGLSVRAVHQEMIIELKFSGPDYLTYVEFGGKNNSAFPFIRPAVIKLRQKMYKHGKTFFSGVTRDNIMDDGE
jgi:hypothetical protein